MRALLWLCSLSGINAFVTTPSITRSVSSFSASRLLVHTLHPEIPNPENERFAKDIETVVKKLRPWSRDPTMKAPFRRRELSFTNIYSKEMWDKHTSRWRYIRFLKEWPTSRLLRRILPQWSVFVGWCFCAERVLKRRSEIAVPLTPLSLLSTFVAALLTLRSNQGLSRQSEGLEAVSKVVHHTRDFAHLLTAYVYPHDPVLALMMARHISVFGWSLKGWLRQSDERDIIDTMLSPEEAEFVLNQRKPPVAVLARLRQAVADLGRRQLLAVPQHNALDSTISNLHGVVKVCERIQSSPIPAVYTAHTSRLLMVYLFFLPLALHGSGKSVLVASLVGFAMLGLDEISHFLEEPFRLMPMYQLAKNSMLDVSEATVTQPPPLPRAAAVMDFPEMNSQSGTRIAAHQPYTNGGGGNPNSNNHHNGIHNDNHTVTNGLHFE